MENVKPDGRFKRSARSRSDIVTAMADLMEEGVYVPTAQQVADKANISIRTVFRHFSDMDSLYKEVDQFIKPGYEKDFAKQDPNGSLEQRIIHLINFRVEGFYHNIQTIKATKTLVWRSTFLKENYHRKQTKLRKLLILQFPELKDKNAQLLEMVDGLTSFEAFDRLYTHQKLSIEECKEILIVQLKMLLLN
ncbi:TetR/AcrR family transcriptional regulator [uncultured Paraglaciecola sp.]|uniref:TetR/AcrR family transcriptional regulator n=1 Tax=uncultured Paraglaciecola sp. TaxID=1765024 RepID=UPI002612966E|nr:TetR/AcrR family transcriptional regulator [uncultured Paraglaciecola sp.]